MSQTIFLAVPTGTHSGSIWRGVVRKGEGYRIHYIACCLAEMAAELAAGGGLVHKSGHPFGVDEIAAALGEDMIWLRTAAFPELVRIGEGFWAQSSEEGAPVWICSSPMVSRTLGWQQGRISGVSDAQLLPPVGEDPATSPKKRGRPALFGEPMSSAVRRQRSDQKKKREAEKMLQDDAEPAADAGNHKNPHDNHETFCEDFVSGLLQQTEYADEFSSHENPLKEVKEVNSKSSSCFSAASSDQTNNKTRSPPSLAGDIPQELQDVLHQLPTAFQTKAAKILLSFDRCSVEGKVRAVLGFAKKLDGPRTTLALLRKKLEDQEDYEAARAEREAKRKEKIEKDKEENLRKEEEDRQAREDEAREYERRNQEVLEQYRCFNEEIKRQLQAEARVTSYNAEGKAFTAALIAVTEKFITTNNEEIVE